MKAIEMLNAQAAAEGLASLQAFEGGAEGFIFKGTNGRWRDLLDADDLAAYQRRVRVRKYSASRAVNLRGVVKCLALT